MGSSNWNSVGALFRPDILLIDSYNISF